MRGGIKMADPGLEEIVEALWETVTLPIKIISEILGGDE